MFFQRVSGEARPKELSSFLALLWEGQGLPKSSVNVSVREAKNPLLRTHTDTLELGVSRTHTHARSHTAAERTPRDSTTNLILCWHTIPQMCHAFTALPISPPCYHKARGLFLPMSVSTRVTSPWARGAYVYTLCPRSICSGNRGFSQSARL